MTSAAFHILLALSGGQRHGYGIMQEVLRLTEGRMSLGPGTLYRSIQRMLDDGLIAESSQRVDPELDDQRRRYYRLTEPGRRACRSEAERLAVLVEAARSRRVLGRHIARPAVGGGR